jgi:aerobic-type carbon monoxide dehydrogenase small subunit (CoxS/CutS family)
MKKAINLSVNGVSHTDEVEPRMLLVHYLRDVLELTGTHVGCETSLCGACTVMLDGQAVKSCTCLPSRPTVQQVQRSKDSPRTANCIRCRKGSGKNTDCSAAIARRA